MVAIVITDIFPFIVPITLIKHYVMKYDQLWLKVQTDLNPHPFELKKN